MKSIISVIPFLSLVAATPSWTNWPAPSATPAPANAPKCPGVVPGTVVLPNLTVPISKKNPTMSYGNSHNLTVFTPNDLGTVINFDLPLAALNKTCSLYFSFPSKMQSHSEVYQYSGPGHFQFEDFVYAPSDNVTYATLPPVYIDLGTIVLQPGNFYHLSSIPCPVGPISGATFSNDTTFKYWQSDKNGLVNGLYDEGCPIGLFTTYA